MDAVGSGHGNSTRLECEIRVQGRLHEHWASWFEGLHVSQAGDSTVLRGTVTDQAALYGLLARLRDLGLALISVQSWEESGEATGNDG